MTERWLPVVGFEGYYDVSDAGRVRSLRYLGHSWDRERNPPLILSPTPNIKSGHMWVILSNGKERRKRTVHTLVLDAFVGPSPPGKEGCHGDGVPSNNRLENLRWDTRSANTLDAYRHGKRDHTAYLRGENHPNSRFTVDDIRCIRAEPNCHKVSVMLGRAFGVEPSVIRLIRAGRTWKHVAQ